MPKKDITFVTIEDIQSILIRQVATDLKAPLERRPSGEYLITPAILEAYGLEVTNDATLRKKSEVRHKTSGPIVSTTKVSIGPEVGDIWEVLAMMASMKADATVVDRVMTIRAKPGLADTTIASLLHIWDSNDPNAGDAVTCGASQYGIIWYNLGSPTVKTFGVLDDNGTLASIVNTPGRLFLRGAATNTGTISVNYTNKAATDISEISCLYKIVGTGQ